LDKLSTINVASPKDFLGQGEERAEIKVFDCLHLFMFSICDKLVRKVQDSTTVTAIHNASQMRTARHGSNQGSEEVVVSDLTSLLVIERYESLVVAVR
jgi:hypothetical protein